MNYTRARRLLHIAVVFYERGVLCAFPSTVTEGSTIALLRSLLAYARTSSKSVGAESPRRPDQRWFKVDDLILQNCRWRVKRFRFFLSRKCFPLYHCFSKTWDSYNSIISFFSLQSTVLGIEFRVFYFQSHHISGSFWDEKYPRLQIFVGDIFEVVLWEHAISRRIWRKIIERGCFRINLRERVINQNVARKYARKSISLLYYILVNYIKIRI